MNKMKFKLITNQPEKCRYNSISFNLTMIMNKMKFKLITNQPGNCKYKLI